MITLGSGNELLIGVAGILAIIIFSTPRSDHDSLQPSPSPLLIAFDTPLCSLVSGSSRHSSTDARGCLSVVLHEDGPDHLLAIGVPGGNVEELLRGLWLFMAKLVH
jgi:hypothetical protein